MGRGGFVPPPARLMKTTGGPAVAAAWLLKLMQQRPGALDVVTVNRKHKGDRSLTLILGRQYENVSCNNGPKFSVGTPLGLARNKKRPDMDWRVWYMKKK